MNIYNGLQIVLDFSARKMDIPSAAIKQNTRVAHVVRARHLYFWLTRTYTRYSLKEIGSYVNRDHASVLHGANKFNDWREVDKNFDLWLAGVLEDFLRECLPELKKIKVLSPYQKYRTKMERKYIRENEDRLFYEDKIASIYNIAAKALTYTKTHIENDAVMEGFRKKELIDRVDATKKELFNIKMAYHV